MNALSKKNRERLRSRHAVKHAPTHALGIEARIVSMFLAVHNAHARGVRNRVLELARERHRADERKRAPQTSKHLARQMHAEAERAAKDVRKKVAKALGIRQKDINADLTRQIGQLTDRVLQLHAEYDQLATSRANDILTEWSDLSERSPRFGDLDALQDMLDEGAESVASRLVQSIQNAFSESWAEMNQVVQTSAGVSQYVWVCTVDKATRPEHLELNGETCDWDDPPLAAGDSSSGEACHAGEDYGCRCVASPLMEQIQ